MAIKKFINNYFGDSDTGKGQYEYTKSKDQMQIQVQDKGAEKITQCT